MLITSDVWYPPTPSFVTGSPSKVCSVVGYGVVTAYPYVIESPKHKTLPDRLFVSVAVFAGAIVGVVACPSCT